MIGMAPYLYFSGKGEEALKFYADVFDGRVKTMIRFGEAIPDSAPEHRARILHAEFEAPGMVFMASDGMPDVPPSPPSMQVALAIAVDDKAEQDRLWEKLEKGGNVIRPLHDTFYGGRLGVVTDRYGICWMLNFSPAGPQ